MVTWHPPFVLHLKDVFPSARVSRSGKSVRINFKSEFFTKGERECLFRVVMAGTKRAHVVVKIADEDFLLTLKSRKELMND